MRLALLATAISLIMGVAVAPNIITNTQDIQSEKITVSWELWFTKAPRYTVGDVVYYAPGVMEATAEVRLLDLDEYLDGVSLMSPADIGKTVWIKRPNNGWEGPFLSVDCAQQNDMYNAVVNRGEVVEVGFKTALRWGLVKVSNKRWRTVEWKIEDVEVYVGERLPFSIRFSKYLNYQLEPVDYVEWFLDNLEYGTLYPQPVYYPPTYWRLPDGTFLDSSIY